MVHDALHRRRARLAGRLGVHIFEDFVAVASFCLREAEVLDDVRPILPPSGEMADEAADIVAAQSDHAIHVEYARVKESHHVRRTIPEWPREMRRLVPPTHRVQRNDVVTPSRR